MTKGVLAWLGLTMMAVAAAAQTTVTTSGGTTNTVPVFTGSATVGNSPITVSGGNIGTNYFDAAARPCLTTGTTSNSTWSASFPANLFQTNPNSTSPGYAPFGGLGKWYMGSTSSTASTGCTSSPSSTINVNQNYTNRLWPTNITATGLIP